MTQLNLDKQTLYCGTEMPDRFSKQTCLHYPLIEIIPRPFDKNLISYLGKCSHLIFTSKHAVDIFFQGLQDIPILSHTCLVIGISTAKRLLSYGSFSLKIASPSTQEGMIALLEKETPSAVLYPRSSLARPLLAQYLQSKSYPHLTFDLYDTLEKTLVNPPCLEAFDEVILTSPSVVRAFFSQFKKIPKDLKILCEGPITQEAFDSINKC